MNTFTRYCLLLLLPGLPIGAWAQQLEASNANPSYVISSNSAWQEGQLRTLEKVFTELESRYHVTIAYKSDLIRNKTVQSFKSFKSVDETLKRLLKPHKLDFRKEGAVYVIVGSEGDNEAKVPAGSPSDSSAGNNSLQGIMLLNGVKNLSIHPGSTKAVTVTGRVISENQEPIPGVNVLLKGTTTGTTTNGDGHYSLEIPDHSGTLIFSYIGYLTEEVPISNRTTIDVSLVPDVKSLNEVIVVGYGTQQKKDLTGAVSSLDSKTIADRQSVQLSDALQGTMAGVTVTRSGGQPGAGSTVRIRGVTSLNVNDPLVIVDGVPGLGLNDINPNDVESITVLKDAASQAIYGARAAAGVILVTTKRAKAGKLQVNYDYEFGLNTPTRLPAFANAQTYRNLANERSRNDGGGNIFNLTENENYAQLHADDPDKYPDTDWQKAILSKPNAQRHRHDLSLAVGSEKVKTRASFGYVSEDGLYLNRNFQRYTFRVNNNFNLHKMLEANVDVYYQRTRTTFAFIVIIGKMRVYATDIYGFMY